jgi:hypothetical protein
MATIIPMSTNTMIAACIQIQVGDIVAQRIDARGPIGVGDGASDYRVDMAGCP